MSSSSNLPNRPVLVGSVLAVLGAVGVAIVGALSPACAPTCDLVGCHSGVLFTLPDGVEGAFSATIRGQLASGGDVDITVDCPAEEWVAHDVAEDSDGTGASVECLSGRALRWAVYDDLAGAQTAPLLDRATVEVVMTSPGFAGGTARYGAEVDAIDYETKQPNGPACAPTCRLAADIPLGPLP